jgi:hypothetical protein
MGLTNAQQLNRNPRDEGGIKEVKREVTGQADQADAVHVSSPGTSLSSLRG